MKEVVQEITGGSEKDLYTTIVAGRDQILTRDQKLIGEDNDRPGTHR